MVPAPSFRSFFFLLNIGKYLVGFIKRVLQGIAMVLQIIKKSPINYKLSHFMEDQKAMECMADQRNTNKKRGCRRHPPAIPPGLLRYIYNPVIQHYNKKRYCKGIAFQKEKPGHY